MTLEEKPEGRKKERKEAGRANVLSYYFFLIKVENFEI